MTTTPRLHLHAVGGLPAVAFMARDRAEQVT